MSKELKRTDELILSDGTPLITYLGLIRDSINTYYPSIKIDKRTTKEGHTLTLATIVRVVKDGVWFDIPIQDHYNISDNKEDVELYNAFILFSKNVYIHHHLYIVGPDTAVISTTQETEVERLTKLSTHGK